VQGGHDYFWIVEGTYIIACVFLLRELVMVEETAKFVHAKSSLKQDKFHSPPQHVDRHMNQKTKDIKTLEDTISETPPNTVVVPHPSLKAR
jgi:hypothetical protein